MSATHTLGSSPVLSSGMPMTAASDIAGWNSSSDSNSAGCNLKCTKLNNLSGQISSGFKRGVSGFKRGAFTLSWWYHQLQSCARKCIAMCQDKTKKTVWLILKHVTLEFCFDIWNGFLSKRHNKTDDLI